MEIAVLRGVPAQVSRHLAPTPSRADLILLVPGNPGLAQLYRPLAARLWAAGAGRWSVGVAAHAGHAPGHGHPSPEGWFSLADQLAHHRAFLQDFPTAAGQRVHVVGHSIGALLGLWLYDELAPERQGHLVMLMPTLEAMAETPRGRRLQPLLTPLGQRTAGGVLRLLSALPAGMRAGLAARLFLGGALPADQPDLRAGVLGLDPIGLRNVLRLADEELRTVTTLPSAQLQAHARRLSVALAEGDGWNLAGVAARMPPEAMVWQAPPGARHAFLFGAEVEAVADWIVHTLASPRLA